MSREEKRAIASVYLGAKYNEINVTLEGYNQICAIAQATAVCSECREHYSETNPNVAGLLCLRCFKPGNYTYMGPIPPDWQPQKTYSLHPYDDQQYYFLDENNCIRLTTAGPGNDPTSTGNMALTLAYWHFPRPEEANRNGQIIKLSDSSWTVYGDLKTWPVVVLQQGSKWYKNEVLFIAQRNGRAIQLNKRKMMHKQLFEDAEEELRATRTPDGKYIINGQIETSIDDGDIYRQIAKRVGEEMEAASAEAQEDEEPEEDSAASQEDEEEPEEASGQQQAETEEPEAAE